MTAQRTRNNLFSFTFTGSADENRIPGDVYRTYAQDNNFEFTLDVASSPTVETRGGNGIYTVNVYMADRSNDTRRSVKITIEGIVVDEDYHPRDDANCGSNAFCVVSFTDLVVQDGVLNIQVERARPNEFGGSARTPRVNALEVIKTAANPTPVDITGDGNITALDAVYVLNRLNQTKDETNFLADVNDDGVITVADAEVVIAAIGSTVPQP